jgi:hypothetical protein
MKKLALLAVFLAIPFMSYSQNITLSVPSNTLQRVETLTAKEQTDLSSAKAKVAEAQQFLKQTENAIAAAHKMGSQNYMEWSGWYEIDGQFILYRYQSNMFSDTVTPR